LSAERDADVVEVAAAAPFWQGIDEEADELLVAAFGELDRGEFGSDSVGLRWPSGTGAAASAAPLERRNQQAGCGEALEPRARHVAMHPLSSSELVGSHRLRLRASQEKGLAKLAIPDRIESMVHFYKHGNSR